MVLNGEWPLYPMLVLDIIILPRNVFGMGAVIYLPM